MTPLALLVVSLRKVREFHRFVGYVKCNERREELWALFVRADPSPFSVVYCRFRLAWAFFGSVLMASRALFVVVMVVPEPDTMLQLVLTVLLIVQIFEISFAHSDFSSRRHAH